VLTIYTHIFAAVVLTVMNVKIALRFGSSDEEHAEKERKIHPAINPCHKHTALT
jgi:hypothetical protein